MIPGWRRRLIDRPGRVPRDPQRGAVAVSSYLFILVMLGFFSLALNTGILMDTRTELQLGSDAAALAAVGSLDGKTSGLTAARDVALAYSQQHRAWDEEIRIDKFADVTFGHWHLKDAECKFGAGNDCFEELAADGTNAGRINAVRVNNGRDGDSNSTVALPFGGFVGRATSQVTSSSIAIGPGVGRPNCSLPLVVAECKILDGAGNLMCDGSSPTFVFSNANVDAVGFVNLEYPDPKSSPSGTFVAEYITSKRMCNKPAAGKALLHNGNDFGKVIDALRGATPEDCLIGKPQTLAVSNAGCYTGDGGGGGGGGGGKGKGNGGGGSETGDSNPYFQGEQDIVGFVSAEIVAVTDNHGTVLGCEGEPTPTISGEPAKNSVVLKILCSQPEGSAGGTNFNPTKGKKVRIVR